MGATILSAGAGYITAGRVLFILIAMKIVIPMRGHFMKQLFSSNLNLHFSAY